MPARIFASAPRVSGGLARWPHRRLAALGRLASVGPKQTLSGSNTAGTAIHGCQLAAPSNLPYPRVVESGWLHLMGVWRERRPHRVGQINLGITIVSWTEG